MNTEVNPKNLGAQSNGEGYAGKMSYVAMGTDITLNRFSIYLSENNTLPKGRLTLRDTTNIGTGMLFLGILMMIWSLFRYENMYKQIANHEFKRPNRITMVGTSLLVVAGGLSALWLIFA
jgi:uncharacterized membrane protein YidH (DUF202 family)